MTDELDLTGPVAPPLANGELAFDAPWQGRLFGVARALAQAHVISWDEFRKELIAEIGAWDAAADGTETYRYYDRFLDALQRLLVARGMVDALELDERIQALARRPHGHDHAPHDDSGGVPA